MNPAANHYIRSPSGDKNLAGSILNDEATDGQGRNGVAGVLSLVDDIQECKPQCETIDGLTGNHEPMTGERGGDFDGVVVVSETLDAENRGAFNGAAAEGMLADRLHGGSGVHPVGDGTAHIGDSENGAWVSINAVFEVMQMIRIYEIV